MSASQALSRRLAERLAAAGTRVVFGVPGGGPNLDVVGALEAAGIQFVLAHGETAAGIMAATWGHLQGAPGAVVVTRGPGATSVTNAAAAATLDRHPLIVITDTVPSASAVRVAHQRLDQGALFAPIVKATARVGPAATADDVDDLLATALAEPPGGVHLDYDATFAERPVVDQTGPAPAVAARLIDDAPDEAGQLVVRRLRGVRRPVVLIGRAACGVADLVRSTVEAVGGPVLSTYQAAGVVPDDHPLHAGLFTNGASERPILDQADLVVAIGLDPVEPIPASWGFEAPVIALSPVPTTDPYLPIEVEAVGPLARLLEAVATAAADGGPEQSVTIGPIDWPPDAAVDHRRLVRARLVGDRPGGDGPGDLGLTPTEVVETLAADRPDGLITTVDAGAHFLAIMPMWPTTAPGDLLISNGLATMGYAVPAAIGAAVARPGRPVAALVGDGGLSMSMAELETMARLDLPVTVVVFNDAALSLIEIKQGAGQGGPNAVRYRPTDFASIASAMGVAAVSVDDAASLRAAWMNRTPGPHLIDVRVDPTRYRHLLAVTRG